MMKLDDLAKNPRLPAILAGAFFLAHSLLLGAMCVLDKIEALRHSKLQDSIEGIAAFLDFPLILYYYITSTNEYMLSPAYRNFMMFGVMGGFYSILGCVIGVRILKRRVTSKTQSNQQ